jgi:vang-like
MEPDTYGGMLNSSPLLPNLTGSIPAVVSSSTTINYDTKSASSRRYPSKKRHDPMSSVPTVTSMDNQDERIAVKILPQADHWGELTTASCHAGNDDTLTNKNDISLPLNDHFRPPCSNLHLSDQVNRRSISMKFCQFALYLLCFIAFISPVLYLTLPYGLMKSESISINDYTLLLTIIFKFILLLVGSLQLLYRCRNATYLPRIHLYKACLIVLVIIIMITYWLYYIFQLLLPNNDNYEQILSMTSSYEDLLLLCLLLAVLILEVKWLYPKWIVKVVRSPDGQTRQYTIGRLEDIRKC